MSTIQAMMMHQAWPFSCDSEVIITSEVLHLPVVPDSQSPRGFHNGDFMGIHWLILMVAVNEVMRV
ncbi:MAG: hypothetical protein ABIR47_02630 [Candidatus Kapaibacterium sp.]